MPKPVTAAAIAAAAIVAAASTLLGCGSEASNAPAPADRGNGSPAAHGGGSDAAASRAAVLRLQRRVRWHARRLGLASPPRRPLPSSPRRLAEREGFLEHVVAYLRAREERPPSAAPAASRRLRREHDSTPAGRAYARVARASLRLGLDAPAAPAALDSATLERWRDAASWLAGRSERRRPAERDAEAARIATTYVGVPYAWGGASPAGFDCSGLVSYAFGRVGKLLPHSSYAIWNALPKVPRNRLRPGDMVFFNGLGHVGIYVGRGRYVHAPHSGDVVRVETLASHGGYVGAVRA